MKKIFFLICFFSIYSGYAYSHNPDRSRLDSMIAAVSKAKEDTNKIILLNQITAAFWEFNAQKNRDSLGRFATGAIELARQLSYDKGLAIALLNRAKYGISHTHKFADATTDLLECLFLYEKLNDSLGISKCYLQLGVISFVLQYYEDAIKNLVQSESFAKSEPKVRATAKYLLALSYAELKNTDEAKKYFSETLREFTAINDSGGLRDCYVYMGKMYVSSGDVDTGFHFLQMAVDIINSTKDSSALGRPYAFLAAAYLKKNDLPNAIKYATISYQIGRKYFDEINLVESVTTLHQAYASKGDFEKAYFYLNELKELKDSIFNNSVAQRVAEMKSKFVFEKELNDQKLKQEKDEAIANEQIQRQKILKYSFFSGAVLLLILLLVILNRYRLKQKNSVQLTNAYDHLKATQQQLVQQEKLASLGALTAGIAHEIKNPLNFVNNFSDITHEMVEELITTSNPEERIAIGIDIKQNLEKISHHGKRADSIVQSMLQHSRTGSGEKQLTDINKLCDEFVDLAYHGMRANYAGFKCEVKKAFAQDLPMIKIVSQDISRVVLNLLNNAFYAVKEKSQQPGYQPQVFVSTIQQSNNLTIKIKDNGNGIPKHIKEKIFEPFFTTKPSGEGTGLGLSICYDIIKSHGGEITVESKENEFTEFTITLLKN